MQSHEISQADRDTLDAAYVKYLALVEKKYPDTADRVYVPMGKTKVLEAADGEEKTIWSGQFLGCRASLVAAQLENGTRWVLLQHWHPDQVLENANELSAKLATLSGLKILRAAAIFLVPGEYGGTAQMRILSGNEVLVQLFRACIGIALPEATVEVLAYGTHLHEGEGDRELRALLKADGSVVYTTWFNGGQLI